MTTASLDEAFQGAEVPSWLRYFVERPQQALEDLLIGRAELGHLSASEPVELLLDWMELLGQRSGFVARVDVALEGWIGASWGQPALATTGESATLTAVAWCRACEVIAEAPSLRQAAKALRVRVLEKPQVLEALHEGRARDPLGRAWLAMARHQEDRSLLGQWWKLCALPPDEPWYRGGYGIHGLRGLPAARPGGGGGFPEEVAEGLAHLCEALWERASEGWLEGDVAREEFQRTARQTMAAYPFPREWMQFWGGVWFHQEEVRDWANGLFPGKTLKGPSTHKSKAGLRRPDLHWSKRAEQLAHRLAGDDSRAIVEAEQLLKEQADYAAATGDTDFVVRSAGNFAGKLRERNPEQALAWAQQARDFDAWNAHAWTITAACLLALGSLKEAYQAAWEAVWRFPENVVARTGLAEVLKARGRIEEAQALYQETVHRFPENEVARNGLAKVLKDRGRLEEAQTLYQETMHLFPKDEVARNGLAEVLKDRGRLEEAQALYQETVHRFPKDEVARSGLATVQRMLRGRRRASAGEQGMSHEEARIEIPPAKSDVLPQDNEHFDSRDVALLISDIHLLRRWNPQLPLPQLRERARNSLLPFTESDAGAAGEMGLVLASDDLQEAVLLLRRAAARFPGSARVRYALGRAERALAHQEQRRLDDRDAAQRVLAPWRWLLRMDPRYRPLGLLGKSRAWLTLIDGAQVEEEARRDLGQLGHWIRRQLTGDRSKGHGFASWWAEQLSTELFGSTDVPGREGLMELSGVRGRMIEHSRMLDTLEEEWVQRFASA